MDPQANISLEGIPDFNEVEKYSAISLKTEYDARITNGMIYLQVDIEVMII